MIPSHLSALPCGSCRQPTPTATLQRLGNHFLCPLCREKMRATAAQSRKMAVAEEKAGSRWQARYREIRRITSLAFLAVTVTGFVVLPAIFDPEELSSRPAIRTHASTGATEFAMPLEGADVG